jgi:hypothetical protein
MEVTNDQLYDLYELLSSQSGEDVTVGLLGCNAMWNCW